MVEGHDNALLDGMDEIRLRLLNAQGHDGLADHGQLLDRTIHGNPCR
jgi:hypothetical protein